MPGRWRTCAGPVAAVLTVYETTFKDACVMDWTQEQTTMELTARLQVISLGQQKRPLASTKAWILLVSPARERLMHAATAASPAAALASSF